MPIFNESSPTELAIAIAKELSKELDYGYENARNLQITVPPKTWVEVVPANSSRTELEVQNIGPNPSRLLREAVGANPTDPKGDIGFFIKGNSLGEYHDDGATVYRGAVSAWSDGGTILQVSEGYKGDTVSGTATPTPVNGLPPLLTAIPEFATVSTTALTAASPAITLTAPRFAGQTVDLQLFNAATGQSYVNAPVTLDGTGNITDATGYNNWLNATVKSGDKVVAVFGPTGNQVRTPIITMG